MNGGHVEKRGGQETLDAQKELARDQAGREDVTGWVKRQVKDHVL